MRIITDTCSQLSPNQAKAIGVDAVAMQIVLNDASYKEFIEMDADQLLEKIIVDHIVPKSSQPTPYDIKAIFESLDANEKALAITICDGLSGTYQTFQSMKMTADEPSNIYVWDSKTIAGPQQYLVRYAKQLASEAKDMDEIIELLEEKTKTSYSYLIPTDFNYLARGGRCSPLTAKLGGLLNLKVCVMLNRETRKLDKFATSRTYKALLKKIIEDLKSRIDLSHAQHFFIAHANNEVGAFEVEDALKIAFPESNIDIIPLCPTCIVQGGPGCIAVQVIEE